MQLDECTSFRERAEKLQKTLDETVQWRNSFESSFSVRESEAMERIRQLETDLRTATNTKLDLQRQVAEAAAREASHLQKYEGIVVDMKQAVEKLERKNNQLQEKLSGYESSSASNTNIVQEDETLKQKIIFLEEQVCFTLRVKRNVRVVLSSIFLGQVAKLEQQLEKTRESLTLEREKVRTTQTELYRKEKELSDAKIDVRIANRETKTSEAEVAKLKDDAKQFDSKLKVFERNFLTF